MGKLFVSSYSGGKDGVLALYLAVKSGMTPLALLTSFNPDKDRSWFHGIPESALESAAESMGLPLWLVKTTGDDYNKNFESALRKAREQGAESCVFGDIDIPEHIAWGQERCKNAGLEAVFPLREIGREAAVYTFLDSGFTAYITIADTSKLNGDIIGKVLDFDLLRKIAVSKADICGEYGEYHTFVTDGPIFNKPIEFRFGEKTMVNRKEHLQILQI